MRISNMKINLVVIAGLLLVYGFLIQQAQPIDLMPPLIRHVQSQAEFSTINRITVEKTDGIYTLSIYHWGDIFNDVDQLNPDENGYVKVFSGKTFEDIRLENPDIIEGFLRPRLQEVVVDGPTPFSLNVPTLNSWQLFKDKYQTDQQSLWRIKIALWFFNRDSWQLRDFGFKFLDDECFIAVLQINRETINSEQNLRLDVFLDNYEVMPPKTINALLDDKNYLNDCLPLAEKDVLLTDLIQKRLAELRNGK